MSANKLVISTLAGMVAVGLGAASSTALAGGKPEKCYGVVKAATNDCGTKKHACAGQAKKDGSGEEWIYVPNGVCEKIVGGKLKSFTDAQ